MQPTYRPVRTGGPGSIILVICFLLAAAVTLGVWMYWRRGQAAAPPKPAAVANTNNNPLARASKTLGTVEALNREGEQAAAAIQTPTAAPAPAATATTVAAPTAAAPSSGPRVQAIFFSPTKPTALINGKTVKVGDEVDGLKVIAITQRSVRVQSGAETRELTMK